MNGMCDRFRTNRKVNLEKTHQNRSRLYYGSTVSIVGKIVGGGVP